VNTENHIYVYDHQETIKKYSFTGLLLGTWTVTLGVNIPPNAYAATTFLQSTDQPNQVWLKRPVFYNDNTDCSVRLVQLNADGSRTILQSYISTDPDLIKAKDASKLW
jgi:hypothetical protein